MIEKKAELTKEDLAAYAFVDKLVKEKKVDFWEGISPLWHGWALRKAFIAGCNFKKDKKNG